MKGRKVLLAAEHHNWGLSSIGDWQQTKYTLFDDGILQSVVFEGASVSSFEKRLSRDRLKFIRDNIKDFVLNAEDSDGCDGDAWQFEGAGYSYHLGYIYGGLSTFDALIVHGTAGWGSCDERYKNQAPQLTCKRFFSQGGAMIPPEGESIICPP